MAAFNGMAVVDGFTVFINSIFLLSGLAAIGLAYDYLKRRKIERGEYYPLSDVLHQRDDVNGLCQ